VVGAGNIPETKTGGSYLGEGVESTKKETGAVSKSKKKRTASARVGRKKKLKQNATIDASSA